MSESVVIPTAEITVRQLDNDGEGADTLEHVTIRMDIDIAYRLETKFGTTDDWTRALTQQPISGLVKTLAIITGWREPEVKQRLAPGYISQYQQAVGELLTRFYGIDPGEAPAAGDAAS